MVKLQRKACKNDAAMFGVSRPNDTVFVFLSVNSKTSKKSMADRVVSPRWVMFLFEVLPITDKKQRGAVRYA